MGRIHFSVLLFQWYFFTVGSRENPKERKDSYFRLDKPGTGLQENMGIENLNLVTVGINSSGHIQTYKRRKGDPVRFI